MKISREQVLTNPRFAGDVRRYHAWPVLQQQTNAAHSFHCLRIWVSIYGPPSPQVTLYFIWHDLGELVLGDLPFPVKANNPLLKQACDAVEKGAVKAMGGPEFALTDILKLRTKACDLVEMLEFGVIECLMGNKFGRPIVDDISKAIEALVPKLPKEDLRPITEYVGKVLQLLEG